MAKTWANVAILGTGRIYNDGHRKTFVHPASTNNVVVAFCDVQENLAKDQMKWLKKGYEKQLKQAKKKGVAAEVERLTFGLSHLKVYTSIDKMLDELEGTLDVIDNCTPGRLHIPLSVQAMEHGVHAMAEKPPGLNWWDVKRAVAAEQKTKKSYHLMECVCYDRPLQKCRQLIQDGVLGKIKHAFVPYGHGGPYIPHFFTENKLPHFIDPLWCGGGTLQDLAPHGISKALWPIGPETRVISCETKILERRQNPRKMSKKPFTSVVDDWAEADLELSDPRTNSNYTMHSVASWCGGVSRAFTIEGEKGTLEVEKGHPVLTAPDGKKTTFPVDKDNWADDMYMREIQIFCDNILHGKPSDTPAGYALHLQETMSIQYFAKLMKRRATREEMDAWGEQVTSSAKSEQEKVDAVTLSLLKGIDLL